MVGFRKSGHNYKRLHNIKDTHLTIVIIDDEQRVDLCTTYSNQPCDIPQMMSNPYEDSLHEVLKIFSLSGDQLVAIGFLEDNGFSSEVCQIFTGSYIVCRFIVIVVFTSHVCVFLNYM